MEDELWWATVNVTWRNASQDVPTLHVEYPALACLLALFCVVTVGGNVLVMAAVAREPYLRTVTNYFVASLATADCIVGALVMPFCAVLEVMDKFWPFGQDWCDIWHSLDVLASTASILNLCVISLDRYWAITDPMTYPSKMTPRKAAILIVAIWVCSALISFPAISWWRAVTSGPPVPYQCLFTDDVGYLVFSSVISFYGPLSVMVFNYWRIYRAAVHQTQSLKSGTKKVMEQNGDHCTSLTLRIHRGGRGTLKGSCAHHDPGEQQDDLIDLTRHHSKPFSLSRKLSKMAKERKAAKTLGIVMGVFILCWLPFFVVNVLVGICGDTFLADSELVISVVTWLGWINSGMNPMIYACWSRDFRRAFYKLLCSRCPGYRRTRRDAAWRRTIREDCTSQAKSPTTEEITL
ncbi:GPRDOP2 [Cordylochernes scorpioides]|nr:GPRDOP2 [Cordylochernes scorpioides]